MRVGTHAWGGTLDAPSGGVWGDASQSHEELTGRRRFYFFGAAFLPFFAGAGAAAAFLAILRGGWDDGRLRRKAGAKAEMFFE